MAGTEMTTEVSLEKEKSSDNSTKLSEEETKQLIAVMRKAQEFEALEERLLMRQPLEGSLCKYTNVVTGWQYRWFVLNPDLGKLEYFEKEEQKKQRPRGYLSLAGAVICPSDEDEQTFTVNALNASSYRLKAIDARERQHWVNRLRATAEHYAECTSVTGGTSLDSSLVGTPGMFSRVSNVSSQSVAHGGLGAGGVYSSSSTTLYNSNHRQQDEQPRVDNLSSSHPNNLVRSVEQSRSDADDNQLSIDSSLQNCVEKLASVQKYHQNLTAKIESLPASTEFISSLDKDMLLLKATSGAVLCSLQHCLTILQQQASAGYDHNKDDYRPIIESLNSTLAIDLTSSSIIHPLAISPSSGGGVSTVEHEAVDQSAGLNSSCHGHGLVDASEEEEGVEDAEIYTDTDLDGIEEHKNVILHLLSQLKLGMDLTKVVLPTFILEKRSLLELFADCMAHPSQFLRIPYQPTAEARMVAVLEWYLTSFHAGRQGCIAKKPYNPIIGEHFHCSWSVTDNSTSSSATDYVSTSGVSPCKSGAAQSEGVVATPPESDPSSPNSSGGNTNGTTEEVNVGTGKLYYCAEQVSHHPPISAFYFESPSNEMYMDASIWTRSKFLGMSIGVVMIGKVHLNLLKHGESYEFSLPSAYARSILTVPWVELGDKVTIQCDATGYTASIVFHTKPFYGGKLHKVTAEVRNPSGEIVCRAAGEWNGIIEFTHTTGVSKVMDTTKLCVEKKSVRPLASQSETESRRLWQHVTTNLRAGQMDKATEHKQALEEKQREGEKWRRNSRTPFHALYFHRVGDEWLFKNRLKPNTIR